MNRFFQILREELEFIFDKDYLHNRVELFILKAIPSLSSKEGWEPFQFFIKSPHCSLTALTTKYDLNAYKASIQRLRSSLDGAKVAATGNHRGASVSPSLSCGNSPSPSTRQSLENVERDGKANRPRSSSVSRNVPWPNDSPMTEHRRCRGRSVSPPHFVKAGSDEITEPPPLRKRLSSDGQTLP